MSSLIARARLLAAALVAVLTAAACSDSNGGRVSLALSTRPAPGPAASAAAWAGGPALHVIAAGESTVVVRGGDTLILRSVEVVLRDIELERVEAADCPDLEADDQGCEEFETGPVHLGLPLGNATEVTVSIVAPAGRYDELEFEVHKPDELEDAAFIAAHPDLADVSIRVRGTFSDDGARTDFTYLTDLNEEQEIALMPFLEVIDGEPVNVTLRLDVSTWFLDLAGTGLVNPLTANKGGANENLVRDNIRRSIDAFRDDDRDGLDDDNEEG
ncbi:MAG TPA: hypothetical protein VNI61_01260 [Gemmatimonadales bacterium]|nr:hypothetical protein [Gemmatimonadales bacterium]